MRKKYGYHSKYDSGYGRQTLTAREIIEQKERQKQREIQYKKELRISLERTKPFERAVKRIKRIKDIDINFYVGTQIKRVNARLQLANEREYSVIIEADETGAFSIYDNGRISDRYRPMRCDPYKQYQDYEGRKDNIAQSLKALSLIVKRHYPQHAALIDQAIFKGFEAQRKRPAKPKLSMG